MTNPFGPPRIEAWQEVPESFWNVATWHADGNWTVGSVDIADRKRIVDFFMRERKGT